MIEERIKKTVKHDELTIRLENTSDVEDIHAVTRAAFAPIRFSKGREAPIVHNIRQGGDLTISLVATLKGNIVGHIAFSPVTIDGSDKGWFGLGPVSVSPNYQKRGIGSQLVTTGLVELECTGATGCALIGSTSFYARFGFVSDSALSYKSVPKTHVQWMSFCARTAQGELRFAPAFET
ncbi:MAG: N-acetyltransferase [Pseudomonadota bacterium]